MLNIKKTLLSWQRCWALLLQRWPTSSLRGQIGAQYMSGGSISGSPTPTPAEAAGVRSEGPSSRSEAPQEDAESQRPRWDVAVTNTRALQHKGPFIRWKLSPGADSRQRKPSPLRIATVTHQRLPAGRQTNKEPRRNVSFQRLIDRSQCLSGGFVFGVTAATLRASHCSHYGDRSMLIRQLIVFGQ